MAKYALKRIFLCAVCLFSFSALCSCGSAYKNSSLIEAAGPVELQRGGEALPLETGSKFRFKEGDLVASGSGGSAWFWLDKYKSILLGPDSELQVSHYGRGFNLSLNRGMLFVRIDRSLATSEIFEVITGKVSLSVRGTVFSVQYQTGGGVLLNVFQGRVALCESTGGELATAAKGQSLAYDPETGKLLREPGAIDFEALPPLVAACVADYKSEAAGAAPMPESEAAPGEADPAVSSSPAQSGSTPDSGPESGSAPGEPAASGPAATPPPTLYSVIFDLNGGALGAVSQPILREVLQGQPVSPPGTPERAGFVFEGWFLDRGAGSPADLSQIESSLTVYAGWSPAPGGSPAEKPPAVRFKYLWDGSEFRPAADLSWSAAEGAYLAWQVYDEAGNAAPQSGRIECEKGSLALTDYFFSVSAPPGGLYPQGCTLKLAAHSSAGDEILPAFVMELPYFEVSEGESGAEQPRPVVSTNLGLYFSHSLQSVAIRWEEDHFEVSGTLYPLLGQSVPLTLELRSGS